MGHGDQTTWDVGRGSRATSEGSWGCGLWAMEAGRHDRSAAVAEHVGGPLGMSKGGRVCGRVAERVERRLGMWEGGWARRKVARHVEGWPGMMKGGQA